MVVLSAETMNESEIHEKLCYASAVVYSSSYRKVSQGVAMLTSSLAVVLGVFMILMLFRHRSSFHFNALVFVVK